jgi:asparagine synthase (glutamine-hydrolysing)
MGFAVPLADWFRADAGREVIEQAVAGPAVAGDFLDATRLRQMYHEHRSGEREWSAPLWAVFCFDQFLRGEEGERQEAPDLERRAHA